MTILILVSNRKTTFTDNPPLASSSSLKSVTRIEKSTSNMSYVRGAICARFHSQLVHVQSLNFASIYSLNWLFNSHPKGAFNKLCGALSPTVHSLIHTPFAYLSFILFKSTLIVVDFQSDIKCENRTHSFL